MSEMQQLEKVAKETYARERFDEVGKYLDTLISETEATLYWSLRGDLLVFFTFIGYWIILTAGLFLDVPEGFREEAVEWAMFVMVVAILRQASLERRWREAEGEWRGAITVLRKLGMLKDEDIGGRKKKKVEREPVLARIKGLWEKVWERQSKDALQTA